MGSPARFQAITPPRTLTASYPALRARPVARELRAPEWHRKATCRSPSSSPNRPLSCPSGMLTAPRIRPVRSSTGCRTSTSTSCRLARPAAACSAVIEGLRLSSISALRVHRPGDVRSALSRSVNDGGKTAPHFDRGVGELVVADDREHPIGVDGGDVRLPVLLVDDDVAGEKGSE